jgi:hypothetical protein
MRQPAGISKESPPRVMKGLVPPFHRGMPRVPKPTRQPGQPLFRVRPQFPRDTSGDGRRYCRHAPSIASPSLPHRREGRCMGPDVEPDVEPSDSPGGRDVPVHLSRRLPRLQPGCPSPSFRPLFLLSRTRCRRPQGRPAAGYPGRMASSGPVRGQPGESSPHHRPGTPGEQPSHGSDPDNGSGRGHAAAGTRSTPVSGWGGTIAPMDPGGLSLAGALGL